MREVLKQLFFYEQTLNKELKELENEPENEINKRVITIKYGELKRIEHLMDIAYKSMGV